MMKRAGLLTADTGKEAGGVPIFKHVGFLSRRSGTAVNLTCQRRENDTEWKKSGAVWPGPGYGAR